MQVRAVRPIPAGDALTVAYVGVMEPRAVRARELLESKHFVCGCERCTEPLAQSVDLCLEVWPPRILGPAAASACGSTVLEQQQNVHIGSPYSALRFKQHCCLQLQSGPEYGCAPMLLCYPFCCCCRLRWGFLRRTWCP